MMRRGTFGSEPGGAVSTACAMAVLPRIESTTRTDCPAMMFHRFMWTRRECCGWALKAGWPDFKAANGLDTPRTKDWPVTALVTCSKMLKGFFGWDQAPG